MTEETKPAKKPRVKKEPPKQADFLGTNLAIDDMVAFSQGGASVMAFGRVLGFTAKSIRIEVIPMPNMKVSVGYSRRDTITRSPSQVVKLPSNIQEFSYLPKEWIIQVFG